MPPLPQRAPPSGLTLIILFLFAATLPCDSFNVDTVNYIKHRGNPGSMFGFSVAAHREQGNSWVIVGAPEAQTAQPGVTKGGAVFRCDIARDDACSLINFDTNGNNNNSKGEQIDMKSNQWFGATVRSSGQDGVILACAPRYIWFTTDLSRRDPVGTCYTARNQFTEFAEYSPCRTRHWGYHRQGSCQAGLGASVSKDGKRLYLGAVGSYFWQGQVISQSSHSRPDVISTKEGPNMYDDSYLGYSVAVGDFSGGSGGYNDVAVGMPKGAALFGEVVLYTWNLTNLVNISGEQLGSYFGYSICTGDIDGDGKDDLIVGAPLFTDLSKNKGHYETGRVYVVYQGELDYYFKRWDVRDGVNSKSRFGLALTSLGDINLDKFGDFAVGAPYDGPHERGAVYIYHGSKNGVRDKPAQVIFAEQVVGQPSTFGFSLAGGMDLDENLYPDLIVGAYESDTAVFLRSRPVIQVESSFTFLSQSKSISLEETNCNLKDRTRVVCLELKSCLKYDGIGVDKRTEFEIQFILDTKNPRNPRMYFLDDEKRNIVNHTIRLDKNNEFCKKMFVYIKPNIRDKLTSLEAEMRYSLKRSQSTTYRVARSLAPVLDTSKEISKKDYVIIQKYCGDDNVCIPDLRLIATPRVKNYFLGSGDNLVINVLVQNEREDAYESVFELQVPEGLNFVKVVKKDQGSKDVSVLCSPPSHLNNNTVHCDIGNPLPKDKIVEFKILLQYYRLDKQKPRYEFFMSVNSTNPEDSNTLSDNQVHLTVPILVETDLILDGSSKPEKVPCNDLPGDNITTENQIGPQVVHTYTIKNKGPSDILVAEALFLWPSYTLAGDDLLYLLEQPELHGNIKCEIVEDVDVKNIKSERRGQSFAYEGAALQGSNSYSSSHSGSSTYSSSSSSSSSGGSHSSSRGSQSSTTGVSSSSSRGGSSSGTSNVSGSRGKEILITEERRREEDLHAGGGRSHVTSNGGVLESDSRLHGGQNYSRSSSSERSWSQGGSGEGIQGSSRGWNSESSSSVRGGGSSRVDNTRTNYGGSRQGWRESASGGSTSQTSGSRNQDSSHSHSTSGKIDRHYEMETSRDHSIESSATSRPRPSGSDRTLTVSRGNWNVESSAGGTHIQEGSNHGSRDSWRVTPTERHYEERNFERNRTWNSRDRKPQVSTSWSINRDGVIESGRNEGVEKESPELDADRYFGGSSKRTNSSSASSSREHQEGSTRRVSGGGRNKNFTEERVIERNTTYSSRGKPVISESASWTSNQDGTIRNGSTSRVFHGSVDDSILDNRLGISIDGISRDSDDRLLQGGKFYSEDKEIHRNSSWSSSSGGRPVIHESRHWRINEDGKITNGSTSRVYEDENNQDGSHSFSASGRRGYGRERGYSTSSHGSSGEISNRNEGSSSVSISENTGDRSNFHRESSSSHRSSGYGRNEDSNRDSRFHGSSFRQHETERREGSLHGSETRDSNYDGRSSEGYDGSNRSYGRERHRQSGSHGSTHRQDQSRSSSGHVATSVNLADRSNNQFSDFGAIARGPKDGKARVYTFDLGVLNTGEGNEKSHNEESSGSGHFQSGAGHGSSEVHRSSSSQSSVSGERRTSSRGENSRSGGSYSSSGGSSISLSSGSGHTGSSNTREADRRSQSAHEGAGSEHRGRSYSRSESHYSSSGGGGSGFSARPNEDEGETAGSYERSWSSGRRTSGGGSRSWSWSSTSGTADGDSAMHGGMYAQRPEHSDHREKRQAQPYDDLEASLHCSTTKCVKVRCTVGHLKKDEEVKVTFKSRVWVQTLMKQLSSNRKLNISSMLVARVTKLPDIGRPDVEIIKDHEVFTQLVPWDSSVKPEVIPLWVVVLSACAGALLLMLVVFLLYKIGFFKRNRPSNSPEKQPLNRNGHYQPGDEAL